MNHYIDHHLIIDHGPRINQHQASLAACHHHHQVRFFKYDTLAVLTAVEFDEVKKNEPTKIKRSTCRLAYRTAKTQYKTLGMKAMAPLVWDYSMSGWTPLLVTASEGSQ